MTQSVLTETRDDITIITINRPHARNAVDRDTAQALYDAFTEFEANDTQSVAILTGTDGAFCAGADLKAIEGHAVAGGMELALWCDLRVISETARFGIFCRRFGVPLIDGGTIRLPRLIGQSRAMDLILTGREVDPDEAMAIGLANRRAPAGEALTAALDLARQIAAFPQTCMRGDRMSALEQWSLPETQALQNEMKRGLATIATGETRGGATEFTKGKGRGGSFE